MLAIATRHVSRARRLVQLLGHNPEYVLGRFAAVRDAYSTLRSLGDAVAAAAPLRIGDLYEEAEIPLAVASSGHFRPQKASDAQAADLKEHSYSIGPHIAPAVAVELQRQCRTLPLKVGGRAPAVCPGGGSFPVHPLFVSQLGVTVRVFLSVIVFVLSSTFR